MNKSLSVLVSLLSAAALPSGAQVTSYDAATQLVTIPSVSVGAATFANVTLKNVGNSVFELQGATEQKPAAPGVARYDTASSVLTLPAVKVGDATFLDVTLLNAGNFRFTLQTATALPAATLSELKSFLDSLDALWASAVPASGELRNSLTDGCYLHDGRTKAWLVAYTNANLAESQQRDRYQIGRRNSNVQVLALRNLVNADGSARREIDAQYDIEFADGTTVFNNKQTLISGSSSGTVGCATPQTALSLRFLGNQQQIAVAVRGRNTRDERYAIAAGAAALNPAVQYRREIRFQLSDPMANANYVIVTGSGPTGSVAGAVVPFSLKMVSPFLMRAAPELAGKSGNYVNFKDDDGFRYCAVGGTAVPVAGAADCAALGTTSDSWGVTSATANDAADQTFTNQGWVAGGVYRFDVYKDDGWKTVNGHANKTPVATYYTTLGDLPFTFVEMAGSGATPASNDKFARLSFGALSAAGVRDNFISATPSAMNVSWSLQPAPTGARKLGLQLTWHYFQGAKVGNPGTTFWPAVRSIDFSYPGSAGTAQSWPVVGKPVDMQNKTYTEFVLFYSDRNARIVQSRVLFQ